MALSHRKRKRSSKLPDAVNNDFISKLPNDVLAHILSLALLPTKYAVAICALSSGWRDLYKLSNHLDFDDSLSMKPQLELSNVNQSSSFWDFVYGVLERCKSSQISKFRLKCSRTLLENASIDDWIKAALSYKLIEIELSFTVRAPYALNLTYAICLNLVMLKLDCNCTLRVPEVAKFPHLKLLYCKEITFSGDCSVLILSKGSPRLDGLNGILLGCPLLEELVIIGCNWNRDDLYFANSLLKRLTLDVDMSGPLDQLNGCFIYFNLPSLVHLKYYNSLPQQYAIRNLNSVVDADFEVCFNDDEYDDPQDLCDTMLELIIGVYSCQSLHLSNTCLEALTSGDFELPIFQNLTRLVLCQGIDVSWNDVLPDFLSCSPRLHLLTLVQWHRYDARSNVDEEPDDFLLNEQPVPSCVTSCLKTVIIKDFLGWRLEMEMVMYFLERANVLAQLVLHWDAGTTIKDMVSRQKRILKFPKASKTCSIEFDCC